MFAEEGVFDPVEDGGGEFFEHMVEGFEGEGDEVVEFVVGREGFEFLKTLEDVEGLEDGAGIVRVFTLDHLLKIITYSESTNIYFLFKNLFSSLTSYNFILVSPS